MICRVNVSGFPRLKGTDIGSVIALVILLCVYRVSALSPSYFLKMAKAFCCRWYFHFASYIEMVKVFDDRGYGPCLCSYYLMKMMGWLVYSVHVPDMEMELGNDDACVYLGKKNLLHCMYYLSRRWSLIDNVPL